MLNIIASIIAKSMLISTLPSFEPLIRRLGLGFSPVEINPRDIVENEMG
jgi:hypothetical protein